MIQLEALRKKATDARELIALLKRRKVEKKIYQGIGIRIDRPKGYVQTGKDDAGATWERTYKTDYGYIPATEGGDAEPLDAYLGPNADATNAHWIVQQKTDGSFDEFKLMLGFPDQSSAKAMWSDHTPEKYYGGIVTTNLALVKSLLGVHPSPSPMAPATKAFHCFDDDMRDWLDARGLLEESALPVAEAILKSADDANDPSTRALFATKCATFDHAMLMAAERGDPSADVVRRVFGIGAVTKGTWSTADVDNFPDSSFLYVEPGGAKDESGKTKPRSLRHFPYRDAEGKVDLPHLRDALSRIPQSNIPADEKSKLTTHAQNLLASTQKDGDGGGAPAATGGDETSANLGAGKLVTAQPNGGRQKKPEGFAVGESDDDEPASMDSVMNAVNAAFDRYLGPEIAQRLKGRVAKLAVPNPADELHYVLSIVLEPETVDAQDDIYDADTIRNAAWGYLVNYRNAGLQHRVLVNYGVKIVESYLAPVDMVIGDQPVKAGTWLIGMYIEDDEIWADIKSGALTGFSIGGVAQRIPLAAA